jgi:uncharacterized protein YjbJ (UPF0337 family)
MGFLSDIKGKVTDLADQAKSGELAAKAKAAAESVAAKTSEVAGEVKERVGELADEHGGKVTDAVAKAGTFVDEKTGGKSAAVTGKINEATGKAVHTVAAGAEHDGAAEGATETPGDAAGDSEIPAPKFETPAPASDIPPPTFETPAPEFEKPAE